MSQTFAELNLNMFKETAADRQRRIDEAPNKPIRKTFPVNELAKKLHPNRQYMKIAEVEQLASDAKRFRLVPDPERGTVECALFKSGQYLNGVSQKLCWSCWVWRFLNTQSGII